MVLWTIFYFFSNSKNAAIFIELTLARHAKNQLQKEVADEEKKCNNILCLKINDGEKKLYILIGFSSAFARTAQTEQNVIGSISFEKCIQNDRNHAPINFPCIWYFVCVWLRVCASAHKIACMFNCSTFQLHWFRDFFLLYCWLPLQPRPSPLRLFTKHHHFPRLLNWNKIEDRKKAEEEDDGCGGWQRTRIAFSLISTHQFPSNIH